MNNQKELYKITLEPALKKIEKNMEALRGPFPFVTITGEWDLCKDEDWDLNIFNNGYWCNSFWIIKLWQACKVAKNNKFEKKSRRVGRINHYQGILLHGCLDKPKKLAIDAVRFWGLPQFWGVD